MFEIRFLHMEETQSNLLILPMKKARPRDGCQLFEALIPKCTLQATCFRTPQSCCRSTDARPHKSGQEAQEGLGSSPQHTPLPLGPSRRPCRAVFLSISNPGYLPLTAHLGPSPLSYSRLLGWLPVCQLIPSTR